MPEMTTRTVPQLHFPDDMPATVDVFSPSAEDFAPGYTFQINLLGMAAYMQTTREGIEAIRDACNVALVGS